MKNIKIENNYYNRPNDIQLTEILTATNEQLIKMYVRCTNKFAMKEMRSRGLL
jgi:hypothetical protein